MSGSTAKAEDTEPVPALEFERVGLTFPGGTVGLHDISVAVPAGTFCVVLGPSGAGKSSLLRTVNGLARPTSGTIRVHGQTLDKNSLRRIRPQIAMIFQHYNLVGRSSVAHNVIAGALPSMPFWRGMLGLYPDADRTKACALIEAVGLEEVHLTRRAEQLSGGQQQRVGVARAFMLDPKIILADEPVASLDPKTSRDVLELLRREARRRGATVLCSLHQIDLAREFADLALIVRAGELVRHGDASILSADRIREVYGVAL